MAKQFDKIISNDPKINNLYSGRIPRSARTFHINSKYNEQDKINTIFNLKKETFKHLAI
jgi:hypothetical protein